MLHKIVNFKHYVVYKMALNGPDPIKHFTGTEGGVYDCFVYV